MSLLLDTHIALWGITADPTLGDEFLDRLRHDPDIFLSPVTIWEITIKQTCSARGLHRTCVARSYRSARAVYGQQLLSNAPGTVVRRFRD